MDIDTLKLLIRIAEALEASNKITLQWIKEQQECREQDIAFQKEMIALQQRCIMLNEMIAFGHSEHDAMREEKPMKFKPGEHVSVYLKDKGWFAGIVIEGQIRNGKEKYQCEICKPNFMAGIHEICEANEWFTLDNIAERDYPCEELDG